MPGLLEKFCLRVLNTIKVGHRLDHLPFALWLGMMPTLRVESKGFWVSLPCDSSVVSTALFPQHLEKEFKQELRDLQV